MFLQQLPQRWQKISAVTVPGAFQSGNGEQCGKKGQPVGKTPQSKCTELCSSGYPQTSLPRGCTEGCRRWSKPEPPFPTAPALLPVPECLCFQFMPLATAARVPWRAVELCAPYRWLCRQPRTPAVPRPRCRGCANGIVKAFCPSLGSLGTASRVPRLWGYKRCQTQGVGKGRAGWLL